MNAPQTKVYDLYLTTQAYNPLHIVIFFIDHVIKEELQKIRRENDNLQDKLKDMQRKLNMLESDKKDLERKLIMSRSRSPTNNDQVDHIRSQIPLLGMNGGFKSKNNKFY